MSKSITPEGKVKSAVLKYLQLKGWFTEINVQSQFTQGRLRGRPDLEASKRGCHIKIEVKRPGRYQDGRWLPEGKLRPEQIAYIDELIKAKIRVFVTSNPEEFMRELDDLEERLWPGENLKRLC
jgi:hypothetical protein